MAAAAVRAPAPAPSLETSAQLRSFAPQREGQQRSEAPLKAGDPKVPARLLEGQKEAAGLRAEDAKTQDAERVMEAARNASTPSLNKAEQANLQRVDPKLAAEATQFDTYSSIVGEAAKSGKTIEQVAVDRGMKPDDFTRMRSDVLQRIGGMDYLRQVIPGFDRMDQDTRETFVENYFAANPDVRRVYINEIHTVAERAAAIPEAPQGKKGASAARSTEVSRDMDAGVGNVNRLLGLQAGAAGANAELTRAQIDAASGSGDAGRATLEVYDQLLRNGGVAEPGLFRRHFQLEREIAQMKANGRPEAEIQPLVAEITQVGQALDFESQRAQYTALEARLTSRVYGEVDPTGARVGGIQGEMQRIVRGANEIQDLNRMASAPEQLTPEQARQELDRQQQIEKLRQEMTGAMEKAVDSSLRTTHEDATELGERKSLAQAEADEKAGEVRLADAERRVVKKEDEDWVGKDKTKRKRVVRRDNIGADIKRVAQDGEEGVRRIMLRQMSTGEGSIIQLTVDGKPGSAPLQGYDADGKPMVDSQGKPMPATWETVRVQDMQEADRVLLDKVYDKQHIQLEDRLLRDFDFAKHPRGVRDSLDLLGSLDSLHLTGDEYTFLNEQFGERIEKAASASEVMRGITSELKAKGIEPGGMLGLLMLLVSLGAGFGKKKEP